MMAPIVKSRVLIPMEIYADFVCPWCFITKRALEKVMAKFTSKHPEVEFEVIWRPYYVTAMFTGKVNRRDFVLKALGSQSEADALMERIQGAADEQGMSINWNGNFGPVQNAHKLVALALRRHGVAVQARVVERLFHDQFVLGKDIFDDDLLVRVGREAAGLDEDDVRLELADQDAGKRLDREIDHAREIKGIDAVPHVIVLNRFKVGGYQEKEVYEDLFNKIFMERIL